MFKKGLVMKNKLTKARKCGLVNCDGEREYYAKGVCRLHYQRFRRNGDYELHHDRAGAQEKKIRLDSMVARLFPNY